MSITSESRMIAKIPETCVFIYVMARVKKPVGQGVPAKFGEKLDLLSSMGHCQKNKTCNRATKISPSKTVKPELCGCFFFGGFVFLGRSASWPVLFFCNWGYTPWMGGRERGDKPAGRQGAGVTSIGVGHDNRLDKHG